MQVPMEDGYKIVQEGKVEILMVDDKHTPEKTIGYYSRQMESNRNLTTLLLQTCHKPGWEVLDAFASTGVTGIRWTKEVSSKGDPIKVTANDIDGSVVELIKKNITRNKVNIEVTQKDASILMLERSWDYIQLDPYGSPCNYMENAFRNLRNGGILGLTCTDISAVCGMYPNVALRHYGGLTCRTVVFYKELGARVVIAAAARAAARCSKGIRVLTCMYKDHYLVIALQVVRGCKPADQCLSRVKPVYYAPTAKRYSFDRTKCSLENPGSNIMELGPVWTGPIFDSEIMEKVHSEALKRENMKNNKPFMRILGLIVEESKLNIPFYWSLEMFGIADLPKMSRVSAMFHKAGYKCSRTHFGSTSLRTDAPANKIIALLTHKESAEGKENDIESLALSCGLIK